ncbi:hypothetical protein QQS21_002019 [Conoideocrella luteorostrata]|uniref:Peptidase A1 domain-containing protein n=1 Tax=Conoideocrella luteorostrata TaxID=1105319 RepID=A0AAJ0CWS6_9HYPO|nr:hypothetical protein QQS21_002019 [Conoideocrella luteorostrata]
MRCLTISALPLLAHALPASNGDGVLHLPIAAGSLDSRGGSLEARQIHQATDNWLSTHTINLTLGTPPQPVTLAFDLGSSQTWVNPNCDKAPSENVQFCKKLSRFDPGRSTTLEDLGAPPMKLTYGIGSATASFKFDQVNIGSATLQNQLFGVATDSEKVSFGIFGAAPDFSLNRLGRDRSPIIQSLFTDGKIKRPAFGLGLGGRDGKHGGITYGGIDVKQFSGRLEKRPVAGKQPEGTSAYIVQLDRITVGSGNGRDSTIIPSAKPLRVLLDSGTSAHILPAKMVEAIIKSIPSAEPIVEKGSNLEMTYYKVDCAMRDSKDTIDFTFGQTVIKSSFRDMVVPVDASNSHCKLALGSSSQLEQMGVNILGAPFLRAVYMVADWKDWVVYLAQKEDCGSEMLSLDMNTSIDTITGKCGADPKKAGSSGQAAQPKPEDSPSCSWWKFWC